MRWNPLRVLTEEVSGIRESFHDLTRRRKEGGVEVASLDEEQFDGDVNRDGQIDREEATLLRLFGILDDVLDDLEQFVQIRQQIIAIAQEMGVAAAIKHTKQMISRLEDQKERNAHERTAWLMRTRKAIPLNTRVYDGTFNGKVVGYDAESRKIKVTFSEGSVFSKKEEWNEWFTIEQIAPLLKK